MGEGEGDVYRGKGEGDEARQKGMGGEGGRASQAFRGETSAGVQ